MTIIVGGMLGPLLITGGYASSTIVPLVINRPLHSVPLPASPSPTPWSIDPQRTREL